MSVNICIDGRVVSISDEEWAAQNPAQAAGDERAEMVLAINAERDRRLAAGFTFDFGGDVGTKVLQTRNVEDKLNWLVSQSTYSLAVAGGQGSTVGAKFRGADNVTFVVSFAAGLSALVGMAAWGAGVMARSWALKDALTAGADPSTLDITTGWPA